MAAAKSATTLWANRIIVSSLREPAAEPVLRSGVALTETSYRIGIARIPCRFTPPREGTASSAEYRRLVRAAVRRRAGDVVAGVAAREREGEEKHAALAGLALDPDAAMEVSQDLAADGQAETGAGRLVHERVALLMELLEDALLGLGRDADAGIGDRGHKLIAFDAGADRHAAGGGE